jgi:hypothetical protein
MAWIVSQARKKVFWFFSSEKNCLLLSLAQMRYPRWLAGVSDSMPAPDAPVDLISLR